MHIFIWWGKKEERNCIYRQKINGSHRNITFWGRMWNLKKKILNVHVPYLEDIKKLCHEIMFFSSISLKKINQSFLCDFSPEWATITQKENQLLKPWVVLLCFNQGLHDGQFYQTDLFSRNFKTPKKDCEVFFLMAEWNLLNHFLKM